MEDNNNTGSDSDSNSIEDSQDYYEPISAVDFDGDEEEEEDIHHPQIGGGDGGLNHNLSNGHCIISETEDGISSISINEDTEPKSESEDETPAESETPESEEEERRRRSALMVENASRVMEAMRDISFPGTAPDWVSDVNEDRWIDQLRRLRSTSH